MKGLRLSADSQSHPTFLPNRFPPPMSRRSIFFLILGLFLLGKSLSVYALELMESKMAGDLARILLEQSSVLEKASWEGSPDDARAMIDEQGQIVVIPRKTLVEDLRDPQVQTAEGAVLGGLYLTSDFQPLIDGHKIEIDRLPMIPVKKEDGEAEELVYLRLTVKHVGEGDWRMLVFGKEATPLIDSPFAASQEIGEGKMAVRVVDSDSEHRRLIIQVFGKYESGFEISR